MKGLHFSIRSTAGWFTSRMAAPGGIACRYPTATASPALAPTPTCG